MHLFHKTSTTNTPNPFLSLPLDVNRLILKLIAETDFVSLVRVSQVSKLFHKLCYETLNLTLENKRIENIDLYAIASALYFKQHPLLASLIQQEKLSIKNTNKQSALETLKSIDDLVRIHQYLIRNKKIMHFLLSNSSTEIKIDMNAAKIMDFLSYKRIKTDKFSSHNYMFIGGISAGGFVFLLFTVTLFILSIINTKIVDKNANIILGIMGSLIPLCAIMGIVLARYYTRRVFRLHDHLQTLPLLDSIQVDDSKQPLLSTTDETKEEDDDSTILSP